KWPVPAEEIRRILSRLVAMVQSSSDLLALLAQVGQDGVDAVLVDGAQRGGGNTELDPTVLRGDPETALVEVGLEATTRLAVGVRDVVAGRRALAGDLADFGHWAPRLVFGCRP